ncbi:MAG: hypothetical protein ACO1OF_12880 [Adhaeribacter sp.]
MKQSCRRLYRQTVGAAFKPKQFSTYYYLAALFYFLLRIRVKVMAAQASRV